MAPYHHPDRLREGQASSSTHLEQEDTLLRSGKGAGRGGRGQSNVSKGIPGSIPSGSISKLKAQRRQTERLLKRDDLTPDVRVTSERRLKTLELELIKAETSSLEKQMVTRYRGIKFFERQKVLRKIKGAKKALLASPNDPTFLTTLFDSRIDLYYILQYPKTQKYIALFPEGSYISHSPIPSSQDPKDAAVIRSSLREEFKRKITMGELGMEAEGGDLDIEGEEEVVTKAEEEESEAEGEEKEELGGKSKKRERTIDELMSVIGGEKLKEGEVERKVKKVKKAVVVPVEEVGEEQQEEKESSPVLPVVSTKSKESKSKSTPAVAVAIVPVSIPEVVVAPIEVESVVEEEGSPEKKASNQSKKEKKDRKDALRKAKKEGTVFVEPVVADPIPVVAVEKTVMGRKAKKESKRAAAAAVEVVVEKPKAVVENWAAEDDFFS